MEMELFSWYEFEGNVVFSIQNLQSMYLMDALIMVSQYIDEFGEEYIIEFIAEFLKEEKVLLVQGSGFNWPHPDHFRLVFLPNEDVLREAIARLAKFLARYSARMGTNSLKIAGK